MKKILMALAIIGITCSAAEAQNKKAVKDMCNVPAKHAKTRSVAHLNHHPARTADYVKNYQVCTENGGYYTCCTYKQTTRRAW